MSQRDRDARAAMAAIIKAGTASKWIDAADGSRALLYSLPPIEDITTKASIIADAMEAERRKRTKAEAPKPGVSDAPITSTELQHPVVLAAIEAARREGRDAGLRDAAEWFRRDGNPPTHPAPDLASLQAVAEAAVRLALWGGLPKVPQWQPLINALDRAQPGWRSKETP